MAPSDATTHIPTRIKMNEIESKNIHTKTDRRVDREITNLFEVTEMRIHCTTNCFQEFKPLFCFNVGKGSYLHIWALNYEGSEITRMLHPHSESEIMVMVDAAAYQIEASLLKSWARTMKFLNIHT